MADYSSRRNYFTKHLFGAGIKCPQKLYYYSQNYPQDQRAVPFIRHAVFNKRLLKSLARSVFPDGIFVNEDSVSEASAKTYQLLEQETAIVFDAVFTDQQMMARLPIVQKKASVFSLFHVQSKTFDSPSYSITDQHDNIHGKWKKYLLDFAYQAYLVRQCNPNCKIQTILVLPEKHGKSTQNNLPQRLWQSNYNGQTADVNPKNQQLLAKIDVRKHIDRIWNSSAFADANLPRSTFKKSLCFLRDQYLEGKESDFEVGNKCKKCEFRLAKNQEVVDEKNGFKQCWTEGSLEINANNEHIFDLIGSTQQWIANGIYQQKDIPVEDVIALHNIEDSENRISNDMRQSLQVHKAKGRDVPDEIMRPRLADQLQQWQYPLHFLDFEAGNYAVPMRAHRSPYHTLLFQFSCHTLYKDGRQEHHQWLAGQKEEYSNYELVRQLMQLPDINSGTIVQYSNFERYALKSIRKELKKDAAEIADSERLTKWLDQILKTNKANGANGATIVDISKLVKRYYYNCRMNGSLGVKAVLKSIMKYSSFLKEKYQKPYSSNNFDDMIWWQPASNGNARNPYGLLEQGSAEGIKRGAEAMVVYGRLMCRDMSDDRRGELRKSLLKYCELDTLAMVMIFEHWRHQIENN